MERRQDLLPCGDVLQFSADEQIFEPHLKVDENFPGRPGEDKLQRGFKMVVVAEREEQIQAIFGVRHQIAKAPWPAQHQRLLRAQGCHRAQRDQQPLPFSGSSRLPIIRVTAWQNCVGGR